MTENEKSVQDAVLIGSSSPGWRKNVKPSCWINLFSLQGCFFYERFPYSKFRQDCTRPISALSCTLLSVLQCPSQLLNSTNLFVSLLLWQAEEQPFFWLASGSFFTFLWEAKDDRASSVPEVLLAENNSLLSWSECKYLLETSQSEASLNGSGQGGLQPASVQSISDFVPGSFSIRWKRISVFLFCFKQKMISVTLCWVQCEACMNALLFITQMTFSSLFSIIPWNLKGRHQERTFPTGPFFFSVGKCDSQEVSKQKGDV